ncbi:MAG: U32 family peptidase [Candidatus Omnitrophota bacterium]|nr:MAG: U32 family peptidase [Candidatus Omnitrophota bacterium]
MIEKKPELVSAAGDWPALHSVVEAGADSVYFGAKDINMRHLAANFDILEIKKVMSFLHQRKRRGYLALNVIVFDRETEKVKRILKEAKQAGVDAVILWDGAVFSLAKDTGLKIHLSTQASVSNFEAVKFYASQAAERIVLARECTLSDIKNIIEKIKKEKVNCEIETFIHGAMCLSISGRCFLSEMAFAKSANRGKCLQPCRRQFLITDTQGDSQYVLGKDYLLSPKDLCAVDFIDELIEAGINAFKIEGRNRSPEYLRVVTANYRKAIDAFFEGKLDEGLKKELKNELAKVYNRGASSGFYFGVPQDAVSRELENRYQKVFLGEVGKVYKKIKVAEVLIKNGSLKVGDEVLFVGRGPAQFARIEELQINHQFIKEAVKGEKVGVKLPIIVKPKDKVFIWRKRQL